MQKHWNLPSARICRNGHSSCRTESRKNLLVGCLNRNGRIRIPRGQDTIQVGDTVIIVTTHKGLRDITDILAK